MRQISEVTRRDLLDVIQEGFAGKETVQRNTADYGCIDVEEDIHIYMPFYGRLTAIEFLDRLYHLEDMPSTDHRYKNAKGDIYCHTVSFNDWPEFWFLDDERFELIDGFEDEPILKFICEMLHPAVREEDGSWKEYLKKFNELLQPDGYEIYASYRISGRDIYKARKYVEQDVAFNESQLFTARYKELIQAGNGNPVDNICGKIDFQIKKCLASIMTEFAEPTKIKPNRYDNYEVTTNALRLAMERFVTVIGYPAIDLHTDNVFGISFEDQLANLFNPYLFDVIELQYNELSHSEKLDFQQAINTAFDKGAVGFLLSDNGMVVQQLKHEVLDNTIGENIGKLKEPGLRELLDEAIALYRQPRVSAHKDAVEKIWDALERLKTYYTSLDKRGSAAKVINDISNGKTEFATLFNTEFKALTDIGNNFRIRHHETNRIDITDARYYDYFFNRCLSLIALAIQYLH
jgi:hypothetical protein